MTRPLPDSAIRLYDRLRELEPETRAHTINAEYGAMIGTSGRTVTAALRRLAEAGHIRIRRDAPHPLRHTTGRYIDVLEDGVWR